MYKQTQLSRSIGITIKALRVYKMYIVYIRCTLCIYFKVLLYLQIEIHERKQIPIPNSWGVDAHGKVANRPV